MAVAVCPSCAAPAVEGARFCARCGQVLERRADERRVVTVLFADLVGFTTLSETRDPEEVKELVDGCFERLVAVIGSFGGRVDKIIGDAIVALFGAPTAHEDDAERAVRAGLHMQRTLAEWSSSDAHADLRMRVGINTGEVLVGALRSGGDYTAMGDVVNTAQRLETIAEPGQVVVGPATHAATRRAIAYVGLGPVKAKGREEAVEAWVAEAAVLPPGARPSRGSVPLVGRDAELSMLGNAIDSAVRHRRAQLLLVMGEAGMGKTRVAEAVASTAESQFGAVVLEGRCLPYGEANVWWPVADALLSSAGLTPSDDADKVREALSASVLRSIPDAGAAEIDRCVAGVVHLLGYDGPLRGIDPTRAHEEVIRSLVTMLEGRARQQAVVLLLSDLHWADDVLLRLIDNLMRRTASLPIVVLVTSRASLLDRWQPAAGRHNQFVFNLDPLDRQSSGVLLDAMLEGEVPHDLRELLLDRSGGNPFYLEELVALLESSGVAPSVGRGSVTPAQLPDTLRGLVAARLDALTTDERCILNDAAVLGRRGLVMALELMAEKAPMAVDISTAIDGLVAKDVLQVEDHRWAFRSDVVREVAYGMLTKSERARRHHGVAHWMEMHASSKPADADRIAHHYATAAGLLAEIGEVDWVSSAEMTDKALEWIDHALTHAERSELHPVAKRLATQALGLGSAVSAVARTRLLLARAGAASALREFDVAGADLASASHLAASLGDDRSLARVLLVRGDLEQKRGDLATSAVTLAEAIDRFRLVGDERGIAETLRAIGMTQLFSGDDQSARTSFESALESFRTIGDRRGEAWALQNLAWVAYTGGDPTTAEAWLDASMAAFTEIGDSGGLGWAQGLLAFVRYHQGRFVEAEALGVEMLADAEARADRWAEGMMRNLLGLLALWTGRAEEGLAHGEVARSQFVAMGDWFGLMFAAGVYGRALLALGRVDEAFTSLHEGVAIARAMPGEAGLDLAVANVHNAAAQAGSPSRLDDLDDVAAHVELGDVGSAGWVDRWVADALLGLQRGDVDGPRTLLAPLLEPGRPESTFATAALALVSAAGGEVERARELAAEVGASTMATYADRLLALIAGGLAAERGGDSTLATAMLNTARELVDASDDRLYQVIVRLAQARADEHQGDPDGEARAREAQLGLASMGITEPGWDTAFQLALGVQTPVAALAGD